MRNLLQAPKPGGHEEFVKLLWKQGVGSMQDGSSYRYGMVNIGGRDIPEVLQIFEYCKRALPFVFADT